MQILFATVAALRAGAAGPTSDLASARYRVILPAQQLARRGHGVRIASLPPGGWPEAVVQAPCDAVVISKSFHVQNEELALAMKRRGVRVAVDFCDDHFADARFGPHFRRLAGLADTVIAGSEAMAQAIRRHTGREATVVTDPVEGPRGAPRFEPRFPRLRLAWFGHPSNLPALAARADELHALAARHPVELAVVTQPSAEVEAYVAGVAARPDGGIEARLTAWSRQATWDALAHCDAAWIPVQDEGAVRVKSPNRLLEAAWAGRFVVAGALPAYAPWSDVLAVGEPLDRAMSRALEDPHATCARIAQAQRRIAAAHSGFACGADWARALGDTANVPLRLNLGCGDKILPGYVNVDAVESRAGQRPDVVCDLHDLSPFADASADEVLAVHVVEHFWRWEVVDVLREWVRVLKPGGRMVLECPNLASASAAFLAGPAQGSRADAGGQRTMWVFYGDPQWRDPLMVHRWGYTPESLAALLEEAGLVDVRREPAQFKLREPRDMRLAGVKPQ
ncbi:MAG TPA: methyltransferase domain-containing protein [Usitatibacter sp.]|nr:methyltransferase domain-containing protein [Usitatibacter sp.]